MKIKHIGFGIAALVAVSVVQAQTKPDGQWRGNFGVGASMADGTSKSSTFNMGADVERATKENKIVFYGNMLYGKSTSATGVKSTSADQITLGGRYEQNITDRWYAYGMGELGVNKPSDIKLRTTLGAGVGYHWIKTERSTVDVFAGLGYTDMDFQKAKDTKGMELQLGEEGSCKLAEGVSLKQRIVLYPSLKDSDFTRGTADVGVSAAVGGGWNASASLGAKFYSAKGAKTETLLLLGLSTKLGAK